MSEQRPRYLTAPRRGGNRTATHQQVVAACRQYLRALGAWEIKVLGGLGQRAGCPDALACLQGRCIALEVKTGTAVLNPAQRREKAALEAAGALYVLAHTVDDLHAAMKAAGLADRCHTLW